MVFPDIRVRRSQELTLVACISRRCSHQLSAEEGRHTLLRAAHSRFSSRRMKGRRGAACSCFAADDAVRAVLTKLGCCKFRVYINIPLQPAGVVQWVSREERDFLTFWVFDRCRNKVEVIASRVSHSRASRFLSNGLSDNSAFNYSRRVLKCAEI